MTKRRGRRLPLPGRRVRGSASGRPVMALLDLLGRRMALRLVWELRRERRNFRALLDACGTNPSVLNARLGELRVAGIVDRAAGGYGLTAEGARLLALLTPLGSWARAWARHVQRGP
jgi:DNA-binding HxlR family transcriptional regulator